MKFEGLCHCTSSQWSQGTQCSLARCNVVPQIIDHAIRFLEYIYLRLEPLKSITSNSNPRSHLNKHLYLHLNTLLFSHIRNNRKTVNPTITMHGLVALALLLVPLVNARPQGTGVVICDSTAVTDFTYENKGHKNVTEDTGDKGWVNYDAQTCTAYGQCKYDLTAAAPSI